MQIQIQMHDVLSTLRSSASGAKFSSNRAYRYLLWRTIAPGDRAILFICLNPSTADESKDDPTIRRCVGFARDWLYSKVLVANLFAFRATKPCDLKLAGDPVGPENDVWLKSVSEFSGVTVAAWGNDGLWQGRSNNVVHLLRKPYCFGLTKLGAPKHPLYIKRSQLLIQMPIQ